MKNISAIIDTEILLLESELEQSDRHGIKTETLKNRVLKHVNIESEDEDREYLLSVGFGQAIQMRLHAHGYRSVLYGHFIKLDGCKNVPFLIQMLNNQDSDIKDRSAVASHLKDLIKTYDAQCNFEMNGKYNVPIPRDELMEMLEADCI